jgi:hypothetical protein
MMTDRHRVSKTVLKAIDLMIGGKAKTITEAADQVGPGKP